MMTKLTDQQGRDEIINALDKNIFVIAGAGSGKTTILVQRIVALIEKGVDISKICAITFTKKAANEFYERLHKLLVSRSAEVYIPDKNILLANPTPQTKELCKKASLNIDSCFLGTIDSFCNKILSEYPVSCNVPVSSSIIEDEQKKNEEYKSLFLEIMNTDDIELKNKRNNFMPFYKNPEKVFMRGIDLYCSRRDFHFNYVKPNSSEFKTIESKIDALSKEYKYVFKFLYEHQDLLIKENEPFKTFIKNYKMLMMDYDYKYYDSIIRVLKKIAVEYTDEENFNGAPTYDGSIVISEDNYELLSPGISKHFNKFECKKRDWTEKKTLYSLSFKKDNLLYIYMNEIKYSLSLDFFDSAKEYVSERMKERGELTFFDNLLYLRNALKEDAKNGGMLINHLKDKFKYYFIDESQDTNPIQSEIFFYLTGKKENLSDIWYENIPEDGSLFIVGDPKQSIYRFQNADIASYFKVADLYEKGVGEVVYLTKNHRSGNTMKKYFNSLFKELIVKNDNKQTDYDKIENENDFNKDFSNGLNGVYELDTNAPCDDVAEIIKTIVNNEKYKICKDIYDGKGNFIGIESKLIQYKDIMVVPNKKTKISDIERKLYEYKIPCFVEGKIDFQNSPSLIALFYIYSYAVTDDIEDFYSLLACDLFKLTMKEMKKVKELLKSNPKLENLKTKISESFDGLIDIVIEIRKNKNKPCSILLESILNKFKIYKYVSDDNIEQLMNVIELVRDNESTGGISSNKFAVKYLRELIYDGDTERISPLANDKNMVSVANLHKVKGLEAPIVILAGEQMKREPDNSFMIKDSKEAYIFKAPGETYNVNDYETSYYEDISNEEKEFGDEEKIRLLYVAATRAQNALIVLRKTTKKGYANTNYYDGLFIEDADDGKNEYRQYVTFFTDNLKEGNSSNDVTSNTINTDDLYETDVLTIGKDIIDSSYKNELPSKKKEETIYIRGDKYVERKENLLRTEIGTYVHELMELMVKSNLNIKVERLVESMNVKDEEFKSRLIEAGNKMLNGGFEQKNGCCPLDNLFVHIKNKECLCEVPFSYKEKDIIIYGIVDLLYKDDEGYHIIDYKTNKDNIDLDKKYDEQLEAYKSAVESIVGEKIIDAYIYHIDI